jgi:signal transduction histidine kinase
MTLDNMRKVFFWFAFLLTTPFIPIVITASVDQSIPLPPKNPTASAPQQTVGTTDSLQKAIDLINKKHPKEALKISLALLKKAKNSKDSILIEKTCFIIANIFKNTNNYEKALDYYNRSFVLAKKTNDEEHITTIEYFKGVMFSNTDELDSAVYYFKRVIKKDVPDLMQAKAYANLSGVQFNLNKLIQAESNALEALFLQKKFKDQFAITQAQNNLASIYIEQHRYKDAKKELLEALYLIKDDNTQKGLKHKEYIYDNLSWVLYILKDYHTYEYQEKSFHIRDSLRNAEIGVYLTEIESKFNAENIKKQEALKTSEEKAKRYRAEKDKIRTEGINNILIIISLGLILAAWLIYRYLRLRQRNMRLQYKQNQLIQQNKLEQIQNDVREKILNATLDGKESERKMIAETLHHSVSSLLSSASLHLQASKMQLKEPPPEEIDKAQIIINEAADKIRNLSHSLVSSVLLKFGLSYAIQDLCDKYSNASLNFHCKCDGIRRYDSEFELKINSIIDELLNNIIKHSKASNAEIKITQHQKDLVISVLDDGKGFNTETEINEDGLGLRQIEARIKKMKGVFKIKSSPNEGTTIFISLPVKLKNLN